MWALGSWPTSEQNQERIILSAQLHATKTEWRTSSPTSRAHVHVTPVLIGTLIAGNYKNIGWKKTRALTTQTKPRSTCLSRFWLSRDFDHSSYLLLEYLQLEKGSTRWPCIDIIWQPAGYLLEIQKTIIWLTSEEEKGYLETVGMSWGDLKSMEPWIYMFSQN